MGFLLTRNPQVVRVHQTSPTTVEWTFDQPVQVTGGTNLELEVMKPAPPTWKGGLGAVQITPRRISVGYFPAFPGITEWRILTAPANLIALDGEWVVPQSGDTNPGHLGHTMAEWLAIMDALYAAIPIPL